MVIFSSKRPPGNRNAALSNFGGPKCPFAPFDAPTPSRGIPIKLVSNLPLPFSSWKAEIAYVPGAIPENSHTAFLSAIETAVRATALSACFGKPSLDEYKAQATRPLSLRSPSISTRIVSAKGSCDCGLAPAASAEITPKSSNDLGPMASSRLVFRFVEHVTHLVRMGVGPGIVSHFMEPGFAANPQEILPVLSGLPLCIVDHAGSILASMKRR